MTAALDRARAQLETAETRLADALEHGGDTAALRGDVLAAKARLAAIEAQAAQADPTDPPADSALAEQAQSLAAAETARIAERIAELARIDPPPVELSAESALAMLRAAQAEAAARAAQEAQTARLTALRGRLRDLEQHRQDIIARRLEGQEQPDDAAQIALADADIEGLRGLIASLANAAPTPLPGSSAEAHAWRASVERAEQVALVELTRRTQARLLEIAEATTADWKYRCPVDQRVQQALPTGKW